MTNDLIACPVPKCQRHHNRGLMMCFGHWRKVPRALQRRVYVAFNNGIPTDDYWEVRREAIEAAAGATEEQPHG